MTLKEFMRENYLEHIELNGRVRNCPSSYGFLKGHYERDYCGSRNCTACWDQLYIETEDITEPTAEVHDNVNHPKHYTGEIECIDAMLQTQGIDVVKGFCIGNAFKYLWRRKDKNGDEDIKKALWYLNKYVELVRGENEK